MKNLEEVFKGEKTPKSNNKIHTKLQSIDTSIKDMKPNDIEEELNMIFSGFGKPYKIRLLIKTNTNSYETSLVTRTKDEVITNNNEIIKIKDIKSIERI